MDLTDNKKRIFLFIFGCLPARLAIAYFASRLDARYLKMLAYVYFFIAIAMSYLALAGKRLTGPETFGHIVWWTPHMRLAHALLYFLFFTLTINDFKSSFVILYLDVLLGFIAFTVHELF